MQENLIRYRNRFKHFPLGLRELTDEQVAIIARSFLKPDLRDVDLSKPWRKYNIVLNHGLRTYAAELPEDEIFDHNDEIIKLCDEAREKNDDELLFKASDQIVDLENSLNSSRGFYGLGHIMRTYDYSIGIKVYGEEWLYHRVFGEGGNRSEECIALDNETINTFKQRARHVS